jgi:hypothetical protein
MGNCCSTQSPFPSDSSHESIPQSTLLNPTRTSTPEASPNPNLAPRMRARPSRNNVAPAREVAERVNGLPVSQPSAPAIAPVESSRPHIETASPPRLLSPNGETSSSPPARYRVADLRPSVSMDSATMMNNAPKPQPSSSMGPSTAGKSARARPSPMASRSKSLYPSFETGMPVSTDMRADRSSGGSLPKAVTFDVSPSSYPRKSANHTPRDGRKPIQPLNSEVQKLLPNNFRYGFECPLMIENCHDGLQIQNSGCGKRTCLQLNNFHATLTRCLVPERLGKVLTHEFCLQNRYGCASLSNHLSCLSDRLIMPRGTNDATGQCIWGNRFPRRVSSGR